MKKRWSDQARGPGPGLGPQVSSERPREEEVVRTGP